MTRYNNTKKRKQDPGKTYLMLDCTLFYKPTETTIRTHKKIKAAMQCKRSPTNSKKSKQKDINKNLIVGERGTKEKRKQTLTL